MIKTIKVSEKGQVALPQCVRETLGIYKGDELILIQAGNKILLEKASDTQRKIMDDFKDILRFSEKSLKEVWDNKADDCWSKYLKCK